MKTPKPAKSIDAMDADALARSIMDFCHDAAEVFEIVLPDFEKTGHDLLAAWFGSRRQSAAIVRRRLGIKKRKKGKG